MRFWHVVVVAAVFGCVDKGPGTRGKQIDPAYIEAHLLSAPPTELTNRLDADLGGKVIYLGNVAPAGPVAPGQKVTIKHYWKVVEPPGKNWRIFSHLRGEPNEFQNVDETDMRHGHGPATWQVGEIIEDIQDFAVKAEWKAPSAILILGLYPRGKHKVEDRLPVLSGPSADNAVIAVRFDVDVAKAPPPPGTVLTRRAASMITIDGKSDEAGWAGAAQSPDFATADGLPDPPGKATAKLTWDDQALYLFVQTTDPDVWSEYRNPDDPLWKADAIEVFIDADGNRRGYVELQINPNNAQFDSWFATTRAQPGDTSWSAGMRSAVLVRGTADKREDRDQGWDVEVAIPWSAVKGRDDAMNVTLPPRPGDRWRVNVVRVDKAKDASSITASSWNRITKDDFHALDRMLTVLFADEAGGTTPAPAGATLPASGAAPGDVAPAGGAATPPGTTGPRPAPDTKPPAKGRGPAKSAPQAPSAPPDPAAKPAPPHPPAAK